MTLFEIGEQLRQVLDSIGENGEVTPLITEFLISMEHEQAEKAENYACLMLELQMRASAAQAQIDQYAAKLKAYTNLHDKLKAAMKEFMEKTGQKAIETANGRKFSICGNGGKMPLVIHSGVHPTDIPEEYQKVTIGFDNDKIHEALSKGEDFFFAHLEPRGTHLRLK